MKSRTVQLLALTAMIVVSGCVGQQSFTKMARTGDTVTLALGGSPSHEITGHVDKNTMQVKITDSANNTYDANLRYLFKIYSDPTDRYNYNSTYDKNNAANWLSRIYVEPNQGLWIAVVDLTDPNTGAPLPLAVGPANFQVITPDLVDTLPRLLLPQTDGTLSNIPIEILPGTGSPHSFNQYGDPIDMEPLPQMEIRFDNSAFTLPYPDEDVRIGAIEFRLDYDTVIFNDNKFPPMITGNINEPRINVFARKKGNPGYYKIMVIPQGVGAGILVNNDPDKLFVQPKVKDLKIYVAWDPAFVNGSIDATNYTQVFQISGYKVVDRNGAPLVDGNGNPLIPLVTDFHR